MTDVCITNSSAIEETVRLEVMSNRKETGYVIGTKGNDTPTHVLKRCAGEVDVCHKSNA